VVMSLKQISTSDLKKEFHRREEIERMKLAAEFHEWAIAHPCSHCSALAVEIRTDVVEEFRFAPKDEEGRPMLYMPYEMGTTEGLRYEKTFICENGHKNFVEDKIVWLDKPISGPPMLGRK
jgi:hypothetical protein